MTERLTPSQLADNWAALATLVTDMAGHYRALLSEEETPAEPLWLQVARGELGVREFAGPKDNPRIVEYHSVTAAGEAPDEIAWCSSLVCWSLEQAGIKHTRSKSARSFLRWGVDLEKPRIGCVVVLRRGAPPSGHVGFVCGDGQMIGGNQRNEVSVKSYSEADVLGYRWPEAVQHG